MISFTQSLQTQKETVEGRKQFRFQAPVAREIFSQIPNLCIFFREKNLVFVLNYYSFSNCYIFSFLGKLPNLDMISFTKSLQTQKETVEGRKQFRFQALVAGRLKERTKRSIF